MIKPYNSHKPKIHETAFVADTALAIGKVTLMRNSSIWPGCVLRGDVEEIVLGENSNIQDGSLVHTNYNQPVIIGKGVTVGHGVIIHGSRIGNDCLIGMGAIILDGAVIGDECIIGAGAVVTEKMKVPKGSLVLGVPGKVVRQIAKEDKERIIHSAKEYLKFSKKHK